MPWRSASPYSLAGLLCVGPRVQLHWFFYFTRTEKSRVRIQKFTRISSKVFVTCSRWTPVRPLVVGHPNVIPQWYTIVSGLRIPQNYDHFGLECKFMLIPEHHRTIGKNNSWNKNSSFFSLYCDRQPIMYDISQEWYKVQPDNLTVHLRLLFWFVENVGQTAFSAVLTVEVGGHEYASPAILVRAFPPQSGDFTVLINLQFKLCIQRYFKVKNHFHTVIF